MDTHVLGTKFNVRSYTTEDRHVTLVQGKVQVTNTNSLSYRSTSTRTGLDLYGNRRRENIACQHSYLYGMDRRNVLF